jgi:hypothetical protein
MSTRIEGNLSTRLSPFGPQWPTTKAGQAAPIGEQVQQALFGRPKPPVLDPAQFPQLAASLRLLKKYRKKLANMAGDCEDDFDVVLADDTIAQIDEHGTIYVGARFLAACKGQPELLVGVLAHEIGHRPKRWGAYRQPRQLSKKELESICRYEETRADIFAGKALAEMRMSPEPMIKFLEAVEEKPHPDYFPAAVRAEVIRDAHSGRKYRVDNRRKMFPGFDRMTSPKGHLGEY